MHHTSEIILCKCFSLIHFKVQFQITQKHNSADSVDVSICQLYHHLDIKL